ncbi:MAG: hypothetical protein WC045_04315, partial [Patescibacteria group bacterium]
ATEINKVHIDTATVAGGTVDNDHQVRYGYPALTKGIAQNIKLGIKIDADIKTGTRIINTATLNIENGAYTDTVSDETVILVPFVASKVVGGNVFARGGITLSNPNDINKNNVLYTIGSGSTVNADSASNWKVNGYQLRHDGQLINYDKNTQTEQLDCKGSKDTAVTQSGYCIMQTNIERLLNGAKTSSTSAFDGKLNPNSVPEGGSLYYTRGLTIGGTNIPPLRMQGRGTVIVDGDLVINSDLVYSDGGLKDIAGFIVRNGNIIIGPNVRSVSGFFYLFSDTQKATKGKFIVETKGGSAYDDQLVLRGSVVSSGFYNSATKTRQDAFTLNRNYVGPLDQVESGAISPAKGNIPPAEDFQYDARIIATPPPGFTRDVFRGRQ